MRLDSVCTTTGRVINGTAMSDVLQTELPAGLRSRPLPSLSAPEHVRSDNGPEFIAKELQRNRPIGALAARWDVAMRAPNPSFKRERIGHVGEDAC